MTWILGPLGIPRVHAPPLHFTKCLISWKPFRSPPINHIYSCSLWWGALSDMDPGSQRVPRGHAPTPSFHKMCVISWKLFRSPPINHIYIVVPYHKLHLVTWIPGTPGGHVPPALFIKCIISWKPFRSPPINHIFLFWLSMALWKAAFFNLVSKISWNLTGW